MGILFDKFVKLQALQEEASRMDNKAKKKCADVREKYKFDVIPSSNMDTTVHVAEEGKQER